MAYEYDVFLSYPTKFPFGAWIHETFIPLFKSYLGEYIFEPTIFIDKYGISSGDEWTEKIRNAVMHSKCLVALWCPTYFFGSEMCKIECAIMLLREKKLGYRTITNPSGLINPVNIFDGDSFPDFAKRIQYLNCTDFVIDGEGFKKTPLYADFVKILKPWVDGVAKSINKAPDWSEDFLNLEGLDEVINKFPKTSGLPYRSPILES